VSEENRKQVLALVALVAILGVAIYYAMNSVGGGGTTASAAGAASKAKSGSPGAGTIQFQSVFEEVNVDINSLIQKIKEVEFEYGESKSARDPSRPVLSTGEVLDPNFPPSNVNVSPDSLVFLANQKELTGIIWDQTSPLAVVDGEVVGVGHEFRDTEAAKAIVVKTIGTDFIILSIPSEDNLEITKELIDEEQ
jgi:hypothetical protein